jgi:hypothetical protein
MPPSVREATYLAKEVYERTVERTVRQLFMYCTSSGSMSCVCVWVLEHSTFSAKVKLCLEPHKIGDDSV